MRRLRAAAIVVIAVTALFACGGGDESQPAELPVPRTEVAGAVWLGQLLVAGGLTADGAASDLVHIFDANANAWRPAPSLPVPLHHTAMAVFNDRVYVVGGYTNQRGEPWQPHSQVYSLGQGEDRWRDEAPLPQGPRGAMGLAAAAGRLVATGGESGGKALARTEIYDPAQRVWRPGPDLAHPREHLAAAALGSRVYAIAGRTASEGNFATVESLDPAGDGSWRREPDLNDRRGGTAADRVGDLICVAGGEEPRGTIPSVECLEGGRWHRRAELRRPRHGLAVMAISGRLHVVAGGERPGLFVSGAHEVLMVPGGRP